MRQSITLFTFVFLLVLGLGTQHLNAQVIMQNGAGEMTEITADNPLLAENGEPLVWITKDNLNNRAVINVNCNQSMLSNDFNNLTTFYRDNLGDVFALHYSAEPEVWNWEWRLDDYTLLAADPTETYTTSGTLTGNVSYGQNSTYGSGIQYTYAGYFTLADPYGGGDTQFDVVIQTVDLSLGGMDIFIEGSNVTINGVGSDLTNASGYAAFNDLTNGSYSYSVESTGYPDVDGEFTISNEDVFIRIDYTPEQTYNALFIISEAGGSNYINNATVTVTGLVSQQTNTSGETTFSNLSNGTYSYTVSATGYEDYSAQFTIEDWHVTLPIALTPTTSSFDANFTIIDDNSSLAIENANITIDGVGTQTSDVNGQASFIDLAEGSYNYTVTNNGYEEYNSSFTINGGDEDITVNLIPEIISYNVYFTVTDAVSSAYIENANINIDGIGNENTNASGEATLVVMGEGLFNYTVTSSGYNTYNDEFIITGADKYINVSLTPDDVSITSQENAKLIIYPNPAHNQLQINTAFKDENQVFTIFDISGKLVKSFPLSSNTSYIDISDLEKGLYLYTLKNQASETITGKLVKN